MAGCLAATLASVISVHRKQSAEPTKAPAVILPSPAPAVATKAKPRAGRARFPAPAPVDPTGPILADLARAEAEQKSEAEKAAKLAASLEKALGAARAESSRWKRNMALTRAQLGAREGVANRLEGQAQMIAFERDALTKRQGPRQRDPQARSRSAELRRAPPPGPERDVAAADRHRVQPRGRDAPAARAVVRHGRPVVPLWVRRQLLHRGRHPRGGPRPAQGGPRRRRGRPLHLLHRPPRRRPLLLRGPDPPGADRHRLRLRAGRERVVD